ncbi:hypothetical protein ACTFIY_005537 [Dictyostelium cf. discoideum]
MVAEIERKYKFQFSFEPKIKGEPTSTSTSSFFPYEWGYGANGFPSDDLQDIIQEYDYQVLGNHIKQTIGQPHQSLINLTLLIIFTYLIPSIVILTKIYNTYAIVFIIITFILSIISIPFIVLFKNLRILKKRKIIVQGFKSRNIDFKFSYKVSSFNKTMIAILALQLIFEVISFLNDKKLLDYILFIYIFIDFIIIFLLLKYLMMFTKIKGIISNFNETEHIQKLNEIVEGYFNPIPFYLSFPENYEYTNFGNCVYSNDNKEDSLCEV